MFNVRSVVFCMAVVVNRPLQDRTFCEHTHTAVSDIRHDVVNTHAIVSDIQRDMKEGLTANINGRVTPALYSSLNKHSQLPRLR